MFIILYRDDISGKRYPGLFALINNKKKEGYYNIFKKIVSIITEENSKELDASIIIVKIFTVMEKN